MFGFPDALDYVVCIEFERKHMSKGKDLNRIIRHLQLEKSITRTNAINLLAAKYGLSTVTLHKVAKHNQMPKRQASVDIINNLLKKENFIKAKK